MFSLPFAIAVAIAAPGAPVDCADLGPTSTFADQFVCYKAAGRKIVVPGSAFVGGFSGPGCITAVGADRLQISSCSPGTIGRKTLLVPFSSIRAVEDDPSRGYVTLVMQVVVVQDPCALNNCVVAAPAPRPAPPPARAMGQAGPRNP